MALPKATTPPPVTPETPLTVREEFTKSRLVVTPLGFVTVIVPPVEVMVLIIGLDKSDIGIPPVVTALMAVPLPCSSPVMVV